MTGSDAYSCWTDPLDSSTHHVPTLCPRGSYCDDTTFVETKCAAGKYNSKPGQSSASSCINCEVGLYCAGQGCDPGKKPVNGKCQGCLPGFMGNTLGTKCILCQKGFFQAKTGAMKCDKCNKDDVLCQRNVGAALTVSNPLPKKLTFFEPQDDDVAYIENQNEDNNDEEGSYTDKFNKAQKEGLKMEEQYGFYFGFLSIISLTISLHRLCPLRCKVLDLLFAGDHFISNKVSLSTKVQVTSCKVSVFCTDIVSSILILVSKEC